MTPTLQLLGHRVCNYADYGDCLYDAAKDWQDVTMRGDIRGRKDWEFVVMADWFRKLVPENARVLDAACGREPLVDWLAVKAKTVVATDLWEPAYLNAAGIQLEDFLKHWRPWPNVFPMIMDSTALQFSDETFDASFSVSSIEHMGPEDGRHMGAVKALQELVRVTKVGGTIAFSTELQPTAEKGTWFFSQRELAEFLSTFVAYHPESFRPPDGADEKFGTCPVAFCVRRIS